MRIFAALFFFIMSMIGTDKFSYLALTPNAAGTIRRVDGNRRVDDWCLHPRVGHLCLDRRATIRWMEPQNRSAVRLCRQLLDDVNLWTEGRLMK